MRKLSIILGGSLVVVIALVIGLFFVINHQFKPEKTVQTFHKAIEDGDTDKLQKIIVPNDEDIEVNETSIKALIRYLQANNESNQDIKDGFKKQMNEGDFSVSNKQLSLFEDGKRMGIFPNYKIKAKGVHIKVKGQDDEDKSALSVKELEGSLNPVEDEANLYEALLPGEYEMEATVQNELGTFETEEKVELWGDSDVSFLIDNEKLALESEDVQKAIINAANQFNEDMSVYVTSGFDVDEFTNVTDEFKSSLTDLDVSFELNQDYIAEMESQFEKNIIDLDSIDLSQFEDEWEAEVSMLVSYKERIQLEDQDDFVDVSYTELRDFYLSYDLDEAAWVIEDFYGEDADESDTDNWENKEEIKMEDSKLHKWSDDDDKSGSYI